MEAFQNRIDRGEPFFWRRGEFRQVSQTETLVAPGDDEAVPAETRTAGFRDRLS